MAWLRITALLVNSFSLVADETLGCFHGHFSSFLPQTPPTSPWHPGPYSSSALCCLNVPCTLHAHSEAGIWASTKEWEVGTIHIRGRSERGIREKYWDLKLNFFFSVSNTTKKLVEGWFIYVPQIIWTNIYCDCYTHSTFVLDTCQLGALGKLLVCELQFSPMYLVEHSINGMIR